MRIVLACSGGLDTSAAIPWLLESDRADVIAVTLDLGQGRALEAVRDRALAAGAVRAHVVDAREEFARDYVLRALRADAVADQPASDPRALGRPLLGQALVEIARIERAVGVAHGFEKESLDRQRLESAVRALNPALSLLAVPAVAGSSPAVDVNLWGRSMTVADVPESAFTLTRPVGTCPGEPAVVELSFECGTPISINGVTMPILDLVQSLGTIAGAHGIGRFQTADGWTEAPAAVVLHRAHRALQERMWDADQQEFARTVGQRYAGIIEHGGWFQPLRESLDAFVTHSQRTVSGVVRLKLFKTTCDASPEV